LIGRIAIILVAIGGALGTYIRFYYTYEPFSGEAVTLLTVGIVVGGGILGSIIRFLISGYALPLSGSTGFPFGVMIANILACILCAGIYVICYKYVEGVTIRTNLFIFSVIGVAGGLSTFSSFALDVALLNDRKKYSFIIVYILTTLILSIGSIFLILHLFPFDVTMKKNIMPIPVDTIIINVAGSFIMGVFIGLMSRYGKGGYGSTALHIFVASGILGGMTTFSSFAMDTVMLVKHNYIDKVGVDLIAGLKDASIYASLSLFGCIFAFMFGLQIVRLIYTKKFLRKK